MKSKLVKNTWWKSVVCGMAMVTFTGVVGMAYAIEGTPMRTSTRELGSVQTVDPQGIDGKHFVLQKENATPEKRGLYISHRPAHFRVNIYGAVKDIHWIDKVVPTDSGHIEGFLLDFDEHTTMMITRRDNKPTQGVSQERWNTTWYDQPIQGMTDEEYMAIWRREDPHLSEIYTARRWLVVERRDDGGSLGSVCANDIGRSEGAFYSGYDFERRSYASVCDYFGL